MPVRLLFLVFCSLFSVNQSISTVVCSSQLFSEGGGASQPRSKQASVMFSVACAVSPFTSTHTEPMRAAVLDSTHSMHQCEILGALLLLKLLVSDLWTLPWTVMVIEILGPSPMLKLLVTNLWTLFCNIMFIHTMWKSCSLPIFIILFSVACEISPYTSTHFEPMRAAVLNLTHSMSKLEIQDEVQF